MNRAIVVYQRAYGRSLAVARALHEAMARHGILSTITCEDVATKAQIVAAYGWRNPDLFRHADRFVHVDLGYWGRIPGIIEGPYKVVIDGRHPKLDTIDRTDPRTNLPPIGNWQRPSGNRILLAGMSAKSAGTYGYGPEEWERGMVSRIHSMDPTVEILYRPKPSWRGATFLAGTTMDYRFRLEDTLRIVQGVICHHSNVAIDACAMGTPWWSVEGALAPWGASSLEDLLGGWTPDKDRRLEALGRLSWFQWNLDEIAKGDFLIGFSP